MNDPLYPGITADTELLILCCQARLLVRWPTGPCGPIVPAGRPRELSLRVGMMGMWRKKTAVSRLGCPVPRIAKVASPREISMLMDAASFGFSRKGKGLVVQEGWRYYLLPYLPESSPVPCWMCVVVAVKEPAKTGAERPQVHYSRLDVAIKEFRRLPNAAAAERDQLLLWVAWDAAKGARRVSANSASLNDVTNT